MGVATLLAGMSFYLFSAALPLYLHRARGYSLGSVGILVGVASVVQLVGTLFVGPLVDRRGARVALRLGAFSYLLAAVLFLTSGSLPAITAARVLQGIGIALVLPSIYTLVPVLVAISLRGTALGLLGAFNNVALAFGPPLGLYLVRIAPEALFWAALVAAALAALMTWWLRIGHRLPEPGSLWKYRPEWTPLYAITFLCVVYWGVVTAFLAIEVPTQQVPNVGWFFTADAIAVMAARIPAGYLADRFGPRWLLVVGSVSTAVAIAILTLRPSFLSLVVAGIGTGISAALLLPPILLELTKRSNDGDRGTAMALYNTSFAAAVGAGSFGGAFIVQRFGFQAALLACIVCTLAATPLALGTVRLRENS